MIYIIYWLYIYMSIHENICDIHGLHLIYICVCDFQDVNLMWERKPLLDFKVKPSECSWQLDQVIMVIRELAETDWWTHNNNNNKYFDLLKYIYIFKYIYFKIFFRNWFLFPSFNIIENLHSIQYSILYIYIYHMCEYTCNIYICIYLNLC